MAKPVKDCVICGKPFTCSSNIQITCSEACRAERRRLHWRRHNEKRKKPRTKTCPQCLETFEAKHANQKLCSRACAAESARYHARKAYQEKLRQQDREHELTPELRILLLQMRASHDSKTERGSISSSLSGEHTAHVLV